MGADCLALPLLCSQGLLLSSREQKISWLQAAGAAQQLACALATHGLWGTGVCTDGSRELLNPVINLMHPQGFVSSTASRTGPDKQGKELQQWFA